MAEVSNPALSALLREIERDFVIAQLLVCRGQKGFELCHVLDRKTAVAELKSFSLAELRALVDFTAEKQFRPLKSAPNLRTGWLLVVGNESELELALNTFYPNALADWFAVKSERAVVTNYREFTARQTGMYRITTMLDDEQAAAVIRACCASKFCLKQRLWRVTGLGTDDSTSKSSIPCLEPCALLLEFARKGMRIEQEEKMNVPMSPADIESIRSALEIALQHPDPSVREADFNSPGNPRRLQLTLEKLKVFPTGNQPSDAE